jgi:type II secretion system protein I
MGNCRLPIADCRLEDDNDRNVRVADRIAVGFAALGRSQSLLRNRQSAIGNRKSNRCRGLTLFEVLLSLAIFVMAMAAIGQLVSNGMRGAVRARLETQAVLRCESKLAEVLAGIEPLQAVSSTTFPDDPNWNWSLSIAAGPTEDLLDLEVLVEHPASTGAGQVSFALRRLMRDPEATSTTSSSSSTQSTSTSTTGGTGS